jgi:hypothetical protein
MGVWDSIVDWLCPCNIYYSFSNTDNGDDSDE